MAEDRIPEDLQEKVCSIIEKNRDELIHTLQELVRIPSVVGQEADAQDYVEKLYGDAGLEVARFDPDMETASRHPAFVRTDMPYDNRPNIVGTLPGDDAGPSIILNGHIDVVSPEPVNAWRHDPWGAEIEGDRLYGRGSGDMKAGLLANYFALTAIQQAGLKPKGTVILQSAIDEEAGGAGGTLDCLIRGYTAHGMLSTEPHNLKITIANAGVSYFRVTVQGRSYHAGLAHLGVNAIGKMYPIYQALIALDDIRGREVRFPLIEKGSGRSCHLNIGTFHAGDWPSSVAGSAAMECRIGYVPGERMAEIKQLVTDTVSAVAQKDPWLREHPPAVEWFGWQTEPWYQDPEHAFVKTLKASAESVLNRETEFAGRAAGLDARFAPYFDMASACTGPVAGNVHGIDEYVEIPSVIDVAKIVAVTTLNWCGYQE